MQTGPEFCSEEYGYGDSFAAALSLVDDEVMSLMADLPDGSPFGCIRQTLTVPTVGLIEIKSRPAALLSSSVVKCSVHCCLAAPRPFLGFVVV